VSADEEHAWFHQWLDQHLPKRSPWRRRHARCGNPYCVLRRDERQRANRDGVLGQTNKAFQVAADHDGIDTDKLTIYINGTLYASAPVSALTGGVITFNVAGLAKGTYVIYIEASGEGGATPSDSITVQVTPGKPSKPRNIRVLVG
jgi:hypothetical protein